MPMKDGRVVIDAPVKIDGVVLTRAVKRTR
jgi:hypothetical protein